MTKGEFFEILKNVPDDCEIELLIGCLEETSLGGRVYISKHPDKITIDIEDLVSGHSVWD